jgi:hypothetical protein
MGWFIALRGFGNTGYQKKYTFDTWGEEQSKLQI